MPIALKTLIKIAGEDRELLNDILFSFYCEKDSDIEFFLHERAVEFEQLSKARTYLICDENQINKCDCIEDIKIYGYIALALKVLTVPDDISNRMRKEIDGYSGKLHGEKIKNFPCYLIGQLSKNSSIANNPLNGDKLLGYAYDILETSVEAVGGRYVMVECQDVGKLVNFYEKNNFVEIASIHDVDRKMIQMIRRI